MDGLQEAPWEQMEEVPPDSLGKLILAAAMAAFSMSGRVRSALPSPKPQELQLDSVQRSNLAAVMAAALMRRRSS